jgi:hypothetical protein
VAAALRTTPGRLQPAGEPEPAGAVELRLDMDDGIIRVDFAGRRP